MGRDLQSSFSGEIIIWEISLENILFKIFQSSELDTVRQVKHQEDLRILCTLAKGKGSQCPAERTTRIIFFEEGSEYEMHHCTLNSTEREVEEKQRILVG